MTGTGVAIESLGLRAGASVCARRRGTLVNIGLAINTCSSRHTRTRVSAGDVVAGGAIFARRRNALVSLGVAGDAKVTGGTGARKACNGIDARGTVLTRGGAASVITVGTYRGDVRRTGTVVRRDTIDTGGTHTARIGHTIVNVRLARFASKTR